MGSKIYGSDHNYMFAIKGLMKVTPNKMLFSVLAISIIGFAYILRIAERPAFAFQPGMNVSFYSNSLWCVLITICTSKNSKLLDSYNNLQSRIWRLLPYNNFGKNHHLCIGYLGDFLCFSCSGNSFKYA